MNIVSLYPLPSVPYAHDGSACIIDSGGVRFAAEEERFLRSPHAIGMVPERAAMAGLKAKVFPSDRTDFLVTSSIERCRRHPDYRRRIQFVREQLQIPDRTPTLCVPHHLAHSALAVLTSSFEKCAFLTLDGGGDNAMGHWGVFDGRRFRIMETCDLSPAAFFTYVTSLVGFPAFQEGKVMGLAAHGLHHEGLWQYFERHFRVVTGSARLETDLKLEWSGTLDMERVDLDVFARSRYLKWRLLVRGGEETGWIDEIPPQDIARTGQSFFGRLLANVLSNIGDLTGITEFACAGGAFQNVAALGDLKRGDSDRQIHVPLAPHDAGLSLGAALWTRHVHGLPRFPAPLDPYLGSTFETADVVDLLNEYGLSYSRPDSVAREVAGLIAGGRIVGWFSGRAEFGARALGARSVLADPRDPLARLRLNQLLKKRDWFMPYAPSVLEEYGSEYFHDFRPSPYMNVAHVVRQKIAHRIPSAIHADGTCRAHTVNAASNPKYREVLQAFYQLTGIPMVLNTSFNRHGEPMVATPRQALRLLLEGCVDALAIEGCLVVPARSLPPTAVTEDKEMLALMSVRRAEELARAGRHQAARRLLSAAGVTSSERDTSQIP